MKTFKVTVAFTCKAEHSVGAVACVLESIKRAGFEEYEALSVELTHSAYDGYEDAKASFYAASEKEYLDPSMRRKEANAYLDAAIAALKEGSISTQHLGDVWQEVKSSIQ